MRTILMAATAVMAGAVVAATAATPARAYEFAYCTSGGWSTDNICRFETFEQCLTFVQGVGGSCVRNPRVAAHPEIAPERMRRRR